MYLQHLYPMPKSFSEKDDIAYRFGAEEALFCTFALSEVAAGRMKALWNRFCMTASALTIRTISGSGFVCRLGSGGTETEPVLQSDDTYCLRAAGGSVILKAKDEKGVFAGFMTLLQLICPDDLSEGHEAFSIAETEIHDAPAVGFRSVHLCIFPESSPVTIEKAIHMAGFLKMTHVVLEFWGTYPYRTLPSLAWRGKSLTDDQVKSFIDLIHSYGMEVIPMINHFGHASSSRVAFGRHTLLNAEPRRAKLFEPDGWTWCLSNPDTYKLLSEMRAELLEVCGAGSYFHLGFDEAYSFATCRSCRARVSYELLAEYVNHLTEDLSAAGRRPILWHDEFINAADFGGKIRSAVVANGQTHNTYPAIDRIDRRVIIADWQYEYRNEENVTSAYFMEKGFDVILCPWDDMENIRSLISNAKDLNAYGVMLTTWDHLPGYLPRFPAAADMLWRADHSMAEICRTESASLLRTLCDAEGDFDRAGWRYYEVLE
ncbi:MAG: family 20 glycosylhydrolase [Clostridia bacterium]|nr:family 20 glycosylhydrolase [Clostridia bacterium]